MAILSAVSFSSELTVPVLVIGAGACGLVAALAARDEGAEVLVLERDALPAGSTALSSGLIPAAGTRFQAAQGIADTPASFAADIMAKNGHRADPAIVTQVTTQAGPTLEWLAERHGLVFDVLDGFLYPGHSALRMHATPKRTGRELIGMLSDAASAAGIDVITEAQVVDLYADENDRVVGVALERPDGSRELIGCQALVLACNGYGGNKELMRRYIPEMAEAYYFGHVGNQGDALLWGEALGGQGKDLTAYQGHGSVASPHGILISWAVIMEGGFQVNAQGKRFSDESHGYSEAAVPVLNQPGGIAYDIYDQRIHEIAMAFEDYRDAIDQGAIREAATLPELAELLGLPQDAFLATAAEVAAHVTAGDTDEFGRSFQGVKPLSPPYRAVKVTGAVFHTQGGLAIDTAARVLARDGTPLPNLFAGGGAARGVSGPEVSGYLSGNGLLTAVTLGRLAGLSAAKIVSA